jgi:hypothetical protein
MAPQENLYTSAEKLWPALIQRAGLSGGRSSRNGRYDKELIDDLKERLFPGSAQPFETLLAHGSLSAEDLLRAFFATLRPFSEMKRDILHMLSAAGSAGSGDSLKIRFNFDPQHKPLDLLLAQFREQMEQFARALVERPLISLTYGDLWKVPRAGGQKYSASFSANGTTPGLKNWLQRYETKEVFESLPDDWHTGRTDVDDRLGRVVELANALLTAFGRHARGHDQLKRAASDDAAARLLDPVGFTIHELWIIESDYWPRAVVNWITDRRADKIAGCEASLQTMMAEIDRLLPSSRLREKTMELVKSLDDILALPVWRYRHEVYAVWLGSLMYKAFVDVGWSVQFHLHYGRLEFAFRGVHLATLTRSDEQQILVWWTELETRHSSLPSGARAKGVKPDYRVRRLPLSDETNDILVVEAKQHLRSSTREFVDALQDYTYACPAAVVMLVNYGPVHERVVDHLPEPSRLRASIYASVRPDVALSVDGFLTSVSEAVRVFEGHNHTVKANGTIFEGCEHIVKANSIAEIHLSWYGLSDLDLYASRLDGVSHVSYRQLQAPGIQHSGDVRQGPGIEAIFIEAAGRYCIAVHYYAGSTTIAGAQARVSVSFGPGYQPRVFEPPGSGAGRWWRVVVVDTSARSVSLLATLDDIELAEVIRRQAP